jgi:hypothetical protein
LRLCVKILPPPLLRFTSHPRSAFRHLDLGQEEDAKREITEALKRDKNLAPELQRHAKVLEAEGRPAAAQLSLSWRAAM